MSPTAERIMGILRNARLPIEHEARLQEAIAEALHVRGDGLHVVREAKMVGGLRIDFAVEHDCRCCFTGIAVKIAGGRRDIFRQLKAYCEDARLVELVVVTSRALALPETINGKPVAIVDLGRAWL
jgi:hypothetical protein